MPAERSISKLCVDEAACPPPVEDISMVIPKAGAATMHMIKKHADVNANILLIIITPSEL
jgi:hypothetical protein